MNPLIRSLLPLRPSFAARLVATVVATAAIALIAASPAVASGRFQSPIAAALPVASGSVAPGPLEWAAAATPCVRWDVTYAIDGNLRITGTPLGAGDGIHPVGPGTLTLRLYTRSSRAQLIAFDLRVHFAVNPSAIAWNATVVTDAAVRVTPDASGVVASGWLLDGVLRWTGPVRGYRTEGVLICDGTLCGKFGAPPPGRSNLQSPPVPVRFQALRFDGGSETFQMPYALVSESDSPPQRTYLAIAGRRTLKRCADDSQR